MTVSNPRQTPVLAQVAGTTTTVTLFAASTAVNGRTVYNDSSATLYLSFGPVASAGTCTTNVAANTYFAFPDPIYGGLVTGAWSTNAGTARTTWW